MTQNSARTQNLPRILGIWIPDWPVQRTRLANPQFVRQSLVFFAHDGRAERVVACSQTARHLGVCVGMRTTEAEALAGPDKLTLLPADPANDHRALVRLACECERFSPTVAVEDAQHPEALLLDITGLASLWGTTLHEGESQLVDAAKSWLQSKRVEGCVSIASTPGLALAVSRYADWLAGDPHDFPAIVANPDDVIDRLPIESLRVTDAIVQTLHSLGIDTVGALRKLPRASLSSRFDRQLTWRLDQLIGNTPEPIAAIHDVPPIAANWPFEAAVQSGEVLSMTVGKLLEQVSTELNRRRRGALRVLISYEQDALKAPVQTTLRLFHPTTSSKELKELADLHASGLRIRQPVRAISVLVGSVTALHARQRTLFDDHHQGDPHELAMLINRLASRVGFDRVSRVEKRKSVDPERAFAYVPATDHQVSRFTLTAFQIDKTRRSPLLMFAVEARQVGVVTSLDGTLTTFRLGGERKVVRCWGPERVETGWWRRGGLRRDAYWVELEDGCRLWLCHDLSSHEWRLAGEFF